MIYKTTSFTRLLFKRKLPLLPSFSLVFLDLQMKLYLLLANDAKWLQEGFRPVVSFIGHLHICIQESTEHIS
jgi:nicotinamide riboside kinase